MEFFKKGFSEYTPRKQTAQAELNYRLAIKEFKAAIDKDSSYTDAHRNLARVYFVQKNFKRLHGNTRRSPSLLRVISIAM